VSQNDRVSSVPITLEIVSARVLYDGLEIRSAPVVWSSRLKITVATSVLFFRVGVRQRVSGVRFAMMEGEVRAVEIGEEFIVGGSVIMDLVPGMLIEFSGRSSPVPGFDLLPNGFCVVVL
jgi:hypothetical protein